MPGVKKKDLYLSQSVGQLNVMAEKMPPITNVKLCVMSAQKLFKNAEETSLLGDEEKAYVLYMKFFNFISGIKKTAEYKKNERYYKDLIGMKTLLKAMDEAEKLSNGLKNRYEEKEAEQVSKKLDLLSQAKLDEQKLKEKEENDLKTEKVADVEANDNKSDKGQEGTQSVNELSRFISIKQLYTMLHDDTSILVMDVRTVQDYNASHIRHTNCINVPGDIIPPGVTVNKIEDSLPELSRDLWKRRALMDFIILVEWSGSDDDLKIKSTLNNLKDAIYKWDRTHIIKSEPLVLQGGYNDLLLFYPMLTTNAHVPRPNTTSSQTRAVPSLDTIDYDLDLDFLKSPEQLAKEKEESNQEHFMIGNFSDKYQDTNSVIPMVDRSNKPNLGPSADNRNINRPTTKEVTKTEIPKINNLNIMRQELIDAQKSKPVKETNIIKQGTVELPKPLMPSRGLKPRVTGAEEDPESSDSEPPSSELSSATSSRNNSTVSLDVGPPRDRAGSVDVGPPRDRAGGDEEENARLKHDTERLVLEHRARIAKLKTEQGEMSRLQEMKSAEIRQTAGLIAAKKKIQAEVQDLEDLLAERERRMAVEDEKWVDEQLRRQQLGTEDTAHTNSLSNGPHGNTETSPKQTNDMEEQRRRDEQNRDDATNKINEAALQQEQQEEQIRRQIEAEVRKELLDKAKKEELTRKQEQMKKDREEQLKERGRKEEIARKEREDTIKREKQKALEEQQEKLQKEKLEKARKEQQEKTLKEQQERARKEKLEREEKEAKALALKNKQAVDAAKSSKEGQKSNLVTPGLRVGWQKILDASTGRYYYINHSTKKTQWEPPQNDSTPQGSPAKTHKVRLKDESENSSGGGLKRSHSSPNIAKMMVDEEEQPKIEPFPQINRTTKPKPRPEMRQMPVKTEVSAAKVRNLQPIWGSMGPGLAGLKNLGNTCYMNSIIQCLSNTMPLTTYFLRDQYTFDVNKENIFGRGGVVAEEFAVLIKALWCGQYKSISPRDFKTTIGKFHELFASYSQQDSQELLLFIMDGLHEDLNRVKRRKALPEQDNDGVPDAQAAETAWRLHKTVNESIIVELFQGQFKSTVTCLKCGKKSVTFDAFMYLTLPIPSGGTRTSLRDCFLHFSKEEKMTGESRWHCPRCKCPRDAVKQIVIWKLPPILLIHLKRFYFQGMWRQKITAHVDFPTDGLDMNRYLTGPNQRRQYSLYGVSNHYGSLDGGHYTAYCKNASSKKWYKYDDHEVYDITNRDIQSSAAYILFYSCIDLTPVIS